MARQDSSPSLLGISRVGDRQRFSAELVVAKIDYYVYICLYCTCFHGQKNTGSFLRNPVRLCQALHFPCSQRGTWSLNLRAVSTPRWLPVSLHGLPWTPVDSTSKLRSSISMRSFAHLDLSVLVRSLHCKKKPDHSWQICQTGAKCGWPRPCNSATLTSCFLFKAITSEA